MRRTRSEERPAKVSVTSIPAGGMALARETPRCPRDQAGAPPETFHPQRADEPLGGQVAGNGMLVAEAGEVLAVGMLGAQQLDHHGPRSARRPGPEEDPGLAFGQRGDRLVAVEVDHAPRPSPAGSRIPEQGEIRI